MKDISVDEWLKLTPKKRLQRGAVISRDRARELGREFDKQTYNVERDAIEGLIKEVETEGHEKMQLAAGVAQVCALRAPSAVSHGKVTTIT